MQTQSITYDPLEVRGGGCFCRDPALCLYILIFSLLCCTWDILPTQTHWYLIYWIFLARLLTARTNPTKSTFKGEMKYKIPF